METRIEAIEQWKLDIEQERLRSREQRTNLLWRVALLERVVWAAIAALLGSVVWFKGFA